MIKKKKRKRKKKIEKIFMFDFWESISRLPEGPLAIILEKLVDSYAVHLDNLTLHVDCIYHCHAGGLGDLLYIMLAYRAGVW